MFYLTLVMYFKRCQKYLSGVLITLWNTWIGNLIQVEYLQIPCKIGVGSLFSAENLQYL